MLSVLLAVAPCVSVQAQSTASSGQEESKRRVVTQSATTNEQQTKVSLKIEEGDRITLRNRFGPIIVTGSGGDTLEATVSLVRQGTASYKYRVATTRSGKDRVMVTTAVMVPDQMMSSKESKPAAVGQTSAPSTPAPRSRVSPTVAPAQPVKPPPPPQTGAQGTGRPPRPAPRPELTESSPREYLRGVGDIRLEVRLPRNAHIDLIDSRRYAVITSGNPSYLTNTRNDVSVTNIDTPVSIASSGDVHATKVGGIEAKTRASSVYVKDVSGPVNISTVTGSVVVKEAQGDVRAVSISGTIIIECVRGRAEAGTADGTITLVGIGGDLEATSTGGTIAFTGVIRDGGRYRLKSMSGSVRMLIQREPPGFMATLSSYKGQILLDFELKTELSANTATPDLSATQGQPVRRVTGRFGEGDARISLDSFSGAVQLTRAPSEIWKNCR